jgi:hypothetical protein
MSDNKVGAAVMMDLKKGAVLPTVKLKVPMPHVAPPRPANPPKGK